MNMITQISNELSQLDEFLTGNGAINKVAYAFEESKNKTAAASPLINAIRALQFYQQYDKAVLRWNLKDADEYDLRLTGSIKMLSPEEIDKDWKGTVYFDSTPKEYDLQRFKPVDMFSEDAVAGIFGGDLQHIMHLYLYEGKPQSLQLTLDNYILMALKCRGFYFWHYLVLYFITGDKNEVVADYESFCNTMNYLYTINELRDEYDKLRKI